jgi:hypothetical protein
MGFTPNTKIQVKMKHVRQFFVKFAKKRNFDPLVVNNWYQVIRHDVLPEKVYFLLLFFLSLSSSLLSLIKNMQGASPIIKAFGNSHVHAIMKAFPEINFDVSEFHHACTWEGRGREREEGVRGGEEGKEKLEG